MGKPVGESVGREDGEEDERRRPLGAGGSGSGCGAREPEVRAVAETYGIVHADVRRARVRAVVWTCGRGCGAASVSPRPSPVRLQGRRATSPVPVKSRGLYGFENCR